MCTCSLRLTCVMQWPHTVIAVVFAVVIVAAPRKLRCVALVALIPGISYCRYHRSDCSGKNDGKHDRDHGVWGHCITNISWLRIEDALTALPPFNGDIWQKAARPRGFLCLCPLPTEVVECFVVYKSTASRDSRVGEHKPYTVTFDHMFPIYYATFMG